MHYFSALFLVLSAQLFVTEAFYGSCRKSRRCCDGKDLNCLVDEESSNQQQQVNEQEYEEPCYCDHGCLELGDCCPDFKDYCGVIDCTVSGWSEWSQCDVQCGAGTSIRRRQIIHPPSNGGNECPVLEEKKPCRVKNCRRKHDKFNDKMAIRETAMLVPAKFAKKQRRQARNYDVRENLKTYIQKDQKEESQSSYCVVFHVDKSMHACHRSEDTSMLLKGHRVCVSCDGNAQRDHLGGRCTGHGAEGRKTRFKNILSPHCKGKWTRLQVVQGQCPCPEGADLVFV
uniref:SMB domain-containing protein n=1 Tax=Lepeophtheirus salmonis TaxID=72036 RepID=A0A0K2T9M9_LEPSM